MYDDDNDDEEEPEEIAEDDDDDVVDENIGRQADSGVISPKKTPLLPQLPPTSLCAKVQYPFFPESNLISNLHPNLLILRIVRPPTSIPIPTGSTSTISE